ncbi:hypothetical protein MTR67_051029 [Solanum verrucosum]|uniref:Uncharacterized protein n=1 Tax=Solanum verrucosum TaxID=315347 RepID=A0AAF0V5N0_SOLVR|nr:hypothetical protein MTR67_051029 [Solanum verrucosum]
MKGVMSFGKKGKFSSRCSVHTGYLRGLAMLSMSWSYRQRGTGFDSRSSGSQIEDQGGSISQDLMEESVVEEATWEAEEDMKKRYPHLFKSG